MQERTDTPKPDQQGEQGRTEPQEGKPRDRQGREPGTPGYEKPGDSGKDR